MGQRLTNERAGESESGPFCLIAPVLSDGSLETLIPKLDCYCHNLTGDNVLTFHLENIVEL